MIDDFYTLNYTQLISLAKTYTKKHYTDLVQESYIEAKKSEHLIKDKKKIKGFIKTIMKRLVIKYYEQDKKETLRDTLEDTLSVDIDSNLGIDYIISQLSEEEKRIVILLKNGYSQKEISHILDINYNTLRSKIKKMRERIDY